MGKTNTYTKLTTVCRCFLISSVACENKTIYLGLVPIYLSRWWMVLQNWKRFYIFSHFSFPFLFYILVDFFFLPFFSFLFFGLDTMVKNWTSKDSKKNKHLLRITCEGIKLYCRYRTYGLLLRISRPADHIWSSIPVQLACFEVWNKQNKVDISARGFVWSFSCSDREADWLLGLSKGSWQEWQAVPTQGVFRLCRHGWKYILTCRFLYHKDVIGLGVRFFDWLWGTAFLKGDVCNMGRLQRRWYVCACNGFFLFSSWNKGERWHIYT